MIDWNSGLKVPLRDSEVTKILKSVVSGSHHASSHVIASITGLPSKVNGFYHFRKSRERRQRKHLFEVCEDVIADLLSCGVNTESQKAWAGRLGLAHRSLTLILAHLRETGVIEANTGRGRYAKSSYSISFAYLESVRSDVVLEAAVGSKGVEITGSTNEHTTLSPFGRPAPSRKELRRVCGMVKKMPICVHLSDFDEGGIDRGGKLFSLVPALNTS